MTQRKWLAECHAWLDDPKSVEYFHIGMNTWDSVVNADEFNPIKNPLYRWRIKPKILSINGREFEAPVDSNSGTWAIMVGHSEGRESRLFWHRTKEARDLHARILIEESTPK